MSKQSPEEPQKAQTGVDPVVLLVLSIMLLCVCGLMFIWFSGSNYGRGDSVADVVGVVGVLTGAVMLYRAVKRLLRSSSENTRKG
ncbi:MAG: hypothetical protein F4X54_02715 [Chloroflexi bacterium]|nr:hypothetical protein [Chloroflexota bacterium]MYB83657.1 hypothetical protein [Chloroflexota bacterium]